jgi:crossover junction endodeoxyribonuclease RusA
MKGKHPCNVQLMLPFTPSVNRMYRTWKGRMLISETGRAYHRDVAAIVMKARSEGRIPKDPLTCRLALLVTVHPPDRKRRDLDNLAKGLQDSLEKSGVYVDDSQIDDLHIKRDACHPPKGIILVEITALP